MADDRPAPTIERLWEYAGLVVLAACLSGPWVLLGFCGPVWSIVGAVAAFGAYNLLLAPRSGVCRGLFWLPVLLSCVGALVTSLVILLVRAA